MYMKMFNNNETNMYILITIEHIIKQRNIKTTKDIRRFVKKLHNNEINEVYEIFVKRITKQIPYLVKWIIDIQDVYINQFNDEFKHAVYKSVFSTDYVVLKSLLDSIFYLYYIYPEFLKQCDNYENRLQKINKNWNEFIISKIKRQDIVTNDNTSEVLKIQIIE